MPTLLEFAEDVFTIDGPPLRVAGITFPTRMILVKLLDGAWWVNSPVSVSRAVLDDLGALGPVKYLVAPTRLHVWRLEEWHALFPEAELWGPPQMAKQFRALPFAGILSDTPPPSWTKELDQLVFEGNFFLDEVHFFHKRSRTVIMADFIQNHLLVKGKPFQNALFKLFGVAYPHGGVGLDIQLSFTDRNRGRQSLKKLLSWDFDKLIVAHGVCIETHARAFVERAFQWLGN